MKKYEANFSLEMMNLEHPGLNILLISRRLLASIYFRRLGVLLPELLAPRPLLASTFGVQACSGLTFWSIGVFFVSIFSTQRLW